MIDHRDIRRRTQNRAHEGSASSPSLDPSSVPLLLLLPGSRSGELNPPPAPHARQLLKLHQAAAPGLRARMVLPTEALVAQAKDLGVARSEVGIARFPAAWPQSAFENDLAIASTGTVTMECAYFGVPAITLYKTSWFTYEIGNHRQASSPSPCPTFSRRRKSSPNSSGLPPRRKHLPTALELLRNPRARIREVPAHEIHRVSRRSRRQPPRRGSNRENPPVTNLSPQLYIIAGPNGAGKTTFAGKFLPLYTKSREFVNADNIALRLSSSNPGLARISCWTEMLKQIGELMKKADFCIETTLAGRSRTSVAEKSQIAWV